jgi:hypothetical protein
VSITALTVAELKIGRIIVLKIAKLPKPRGNMDVPKGWPSKLEIEQASTDQLKQWYRSLGMPSGPEAVYQRTALEWIKFRIMYLTDGLEPE